ncbi:MAG: bifunctional oligoribonuclease/PAP phosphatase NrnA [Candidatus Zixiibacteriota bacterium]|nr:MAG: bifunctional oligoribonuclease/PAP phosphatase NrnA [candidate division Zixibacteria bacterium]
MNDTVGKIVNLIERSSTVLITSHQDPDGDSIGSQLALGELLESRGKTCRIVNQGPLPSKYMFLDTQNKIADVDHLKLQKDVFAAFDSVFVLDCTSLSRLGQLERLFPSKATLVNIDHHPDNERFGTINYLDVGASATGEMIFCLLEACEFSVSPAVATQLYAAILSDTGRFKFPNTSPRCLKVCAELVASGANPKRVTNQIYFNHSPAFLKLLGTILSSPQIVDRGRICALTLKQSLLTELKIDPREVEGLVDYSLFVRGVEIGLLFTEKGDGKTKVNLRSQNEYDVSRIARGFGGGGHRNAAGCTLGHDLDQTKRIILDQVKRVLKDEPVRSLSG